MTDSPKARRALIDTVNSFCEFVISHHKPGWLTSITWQIAIDTFYVDSCMFRAANKTIDQFFIDVADVIQMSESECQE